MEQILILRGTQHHNDAEADSLIFLPFFEPKLARIASFTFSTFLAVLECGPRQKFAVLQGLKKRHQRFGDGFNATDSW